MPRIQVTIAETVPRRIRHQRDAVLIEEAYPGRKPGPAKGQAAPLALARFGSAGQAGQTAQAAHAVLEERRSVSDHILELPEQLEAHHAE
jgi:hypothetical protein